jgi:hypothetical protein
MRLAAYLAKIQIDFMLFPGAVFPLLQNLVLSYFAHNCFKNNGVQQSLNLYL